MVAGTGAGGGPNQLVMAPIIAVGTATGHIYLVSISSGQVICQLYFRVLHLYQNVFTVNAQTLEKAYEVTCGRSLLIEPKP